MHSTKNKISGIAPGTEQVLHQDIKFPHSMRKGYLFSSAICNISSCVKFV